MLLETIHRAADKQQTQDRQTQSVKLVDATLLKVNSRAMSWRHSSIFFRKLVCSSRPPSFVFALTDYLNVLHAGHLYLSPFGALQFAQTRDAMKDEMRLKGVSVGGIWRTEG